ncbi:DUF3043 domain-containing protein [Blastococcus sp. TF02A-26]|uniref:DUF3043 domain-containing protein n=1 Tax=Blastococcus sp. TF02A-26 TaxID=2250577 RepID=UPI000DEB9F3E|nr:DUF3043 domain-containing protein [Blastococcus sp. TF02A-26]RBY88470.1 DUF3043 domain-containing protein [Blastococcus sp. TF02A-26]
MKLRLPGRRDRAESTTDSMAATPADLTADLVRTAGKGRPTPKRSEAQVRRPGPPPPPPTTRKEAYKRMREQQAARRASTRERMAMGDDSYLPARDRGPVRKLVRDVTDARRNLASFFLPFAGLLLISYVVPQLQGIVILMWMAYFLVLIGDSAMLGRRISKAVRTRFPDGQHKMKGLVWYGISRSTMVRRWRFPKPEVPVGADV